MRILVRYQQQFGNYMTKAIDLDKDDDIRTIKQKISDKFKIPPNKQQLKIIRQNSTIRLKEDFNLFFYDIHTNCIIFLEYIQSQYELKQNQQKRISSNFYNKLGLLQTISEEDKEEVVQLSMSSTEQGISQSPDDNQDYIMDLEYDDYNQQSDQREKEIKNQVEQLLKFTQHRKLDQVKDMVTNKPYIMNYLGNCGWNGLHFAIFQNDIQTVDFFLSQPNIDPNQTTLDNWTPLQLSIHRNNSAITKLLLENKHIDFNQITQRGSALHIASKNNDRDSVQILLEKGIDPNLIDEDKMTAVKFSQTNAITQLINQKINIINIQQDKECQEQIKKGKLMKPPQIMGYVYKMNSLRMRHNKRFLFLDVRNHSLYRYKNKDQYPLEYLEIMCLKEINKVQKVNNRFYMKKNRYYFQIYNGNRKQVYSCKHEHTVDQWVKYINMAVDYQNYIEKELSNQYIHRIIIADNQQAQILEDVGIKEKPQENQVDDSKVENQEQSQIEKVNFKSFKLLKELGSGAFGKVFLVKKKDNNQLYAMKALKKQTLILNSQLRYAVGEANILKQTEFPFILELFYSFQTPRYLYLVIEYCQGNDLGFHLARNYTLTEEQAQFYIAELVLALEYLHQKDIVYRDLKPENILLAEDRHIKLADFGLSKQGIKDEQTTSSFCGSPAYLAPELLNNKGSGKQADIYGIGAVLYEMLTGMPPYYHDDIPTMYKQIKAGRITFPENVSENAKDLIRRLLNKNPKERIGAKTKAEIKSHPFFKGIDWDMLLKKQIEPPYLQNDDSDEENCQQDIQQLIDDQNVNVRFYDKDYQKENQNVNRVINFSFSKK